MLYEISKKNLEALMTFYHENSEKRNEATTRIQLIDRIFFECLDWDRNDCVAEESSNGEYADYTFYTTKRVLIVEAKKEGDYFELPAGVDSNELSIKTLIKTYPNVKDAIIQVKGYCQDRGVPIAVISNGHQVISFLASRTDGLAPIEGKAIVYPSLEIIEQNFLKFWDYLSKSGVQKGILISHLQGKRYSPIPLKISAQILSYPGIKNRNPFQTDLQILSDLVLEDLTKNKSLENDFLNECYCQSGALSKYALISKEILKARYEALFHERRPGPTTIPATKKSGIDPSLLAESLSRRPILLIGDVGVGKTTFLKYLIKIEAVGIFENSINIYIDLGSKATLTTDLKEYILTEISNQLFNNYKIDIYDRNFVHGVYHSKISRFKKGIYQDILDSEPAKYRDKEIEYIETLIENRDRHILSSFHHISKGQKKQIILIIDNADQRDDAIQQESFIITQEFAENWPATVFIALRPETFHRSLQHGSLSGYHPKAFTISPPRVDQVIDKRLQFGLKLAEGEIPLSPFENITINIKSITSIIKAFQDSLSFRKDLYEAVDNIAGGNVRKALDFVKGFFGSGHVATQKIIEIFDKQGSYYVPIHEFLRAVIYGDSEYYDPLSSPITNLFDLSYNDAKGHFTLPLVLNTTNSFGISTHSAGFIDISRVYENLQDYGFLPQEIDFALKRAIEKQLIKTDLREIKVENISEIKLIRITTIGAYHIQRLIKMFTYIDAILIDTPILIEDYRQRITLEDGMPGRIRIAKLFKEYLDMQWEQSNLKSDVFDWSIISDALNEDINNVLWHYQKSLKNIK